MIIKEARMSHDGIVGGMPDFMMFQIDDGDYPKVLAVELKAPGEKPSENQLEWKKKIEAAGGVYIVVDSLEAVDELMKSLT
jgi:hypothetical protein